jgi:hypothetical protein
MALLFATIAMTGTIIETQFVYAWHHRHHGHHGGYVSAMPTGGGGMPSGGGTPSGGSGY